MKEEKEEFELFNSNLPIWTIDSLKRRNEPSAVNQSVCVKRYKLTIKLIEEPREVLVKRCKELYKKEDNWLNKQSIDDYVKKLIGKRMYDILQEEEKEKSQTQAK